MATVPARGHLRGSPLFEPLLVVLLSIRDDEFNGFERLARVHRLKNIAAATTTLQ
jgi:hypothetical protein